MCNNDKEMVYSFNDIIELYRKYYLPTLPENYIIRYRIKRLIFNYCKKFKLVYFERNNEIHLPKESFDRISKYLENRYLYLNNLFQLYSMKEIGEIFKIDRTTVMKLINEGNLNVAAIIGNEFYFEKYEVDVIYNYIKEIENNSYDILTVTEIVRKKTKYKQIKFKSVRETAKKLNLTFKNKYFHSNITRIMKNKIDELVLYYKNLNYTPKIHREGISYVEKSIKVSYTIIEENHLDDYVEHDELIKIYIEQTNKKGKIKNSQIIETLIYILNIANINFYMNKSKNSIYILKLDYEKYKKYVQENFVNLDDVDLYYNMNQVKQLLGKSNISKAIKNLKKLRYANYIYVEKVEIDKLLEYKKNLVETTEIIKKLNIDSDQFYKILKKLNIPYEDSKKLFKNNTINKKYVGDIEEYISYKKEISNSKSRYENYKIETSRHIKNSKVKKTYEYYEDYVLKRFKETSHNQIISPLVNIYRDVLPNLKKEIIYYEDSEIEKIIFEMHKKQDNKEFILFINYCKKFNPIYQGSYLNDKQSIGSDAYTEEQWARFGQLLFCRELLYYKVSIQKAIEDRNSAMIWLYCALNYICAWRKKDIINIPFPDIEDLGIEEESYLKIIEEDKFTEEMAQKIVNNVMNKINSWGIVASKTKKTNKQILRFVVSNSYVYTIGLLLYICEVHRRYFKQNNKSLERERLISLGSPTAFREQKKFFGEEYLKIFNGKCFSNLRATKTLSNFTQKVSQRQGWGIGYYLVAIQRGHKINSRGIPETTQTYLESINKDNDIDKITRELFERGTFGFITYQFVKILEGKSFVNKEIGEQNRIIKEMIPIKPTGIEQIIRNHYEYKYKIINDILNLCFNKEMKIIDIMNKIANGKASSKMSYCQCLLKAVKEDCCYKNREDCIGCDYLITEMYFLMGFNNMIIRYIEKMKKCSLEYDKRRLSYVLVNNYLPLLGEAIKYFGRDKTNAFIDIDKIKLEIINLNKNNMLLIDN